MPGLDSLMPLDQFYQFLGVPGVMQKDGAANLKSSPTFFFDGD